MKYIFLIALLFVASPLLVSAHPGGTDSSGGHNCRTNCDSWGVPWNQWHAHGGSSYRPPSSFTTPVQSAPTYKSNLDCHSYFFLHPQYGFSVSTSYLPVHRLFLPKSDRHDLSFVFLLIFLQPSLSLFAS